MFNNWTLCIWVVVAYVVTENDSVVFTDASKAAVWGALTQKDTDGILSAFIAVKC